jgi:hypothetical protein
LLDLVYLGSISKVLQFPGHLNRTMGRFGTFCVTMETSFVMSDWRST